MKPTVFTRKTLLSAIALIITLAGCKRDHNDNPGGKTTGTVNIEAKDLVVPAKFNFETEKDLTLRVSVANPSFAGERFVIKVYTNVPASGELIATGVTDPATYEYNTTLRVPAYEDFIYIEMINQDGSSRYERVKANQFVAALFTGKPDDGKFVFKKSGSGMTCSSGCTSTVNNLSTNTDVGSGVTKCFTGTINNGGITVRDGGIAKICGSGSISGLTIEGSGKVYILEGAILSISNINCNSTNVTLISWSDSVKTGGSISTNGTVENNGKLYVNGDFSINGGEYKNYGTMVVTSNFNANSKFKNYSQTTVNGTFNNNGGGEVKNYCFLWVKGDYNNNNTLWSNGMIKVGQTFTLNSGGYTELSDGALVSTQNATFNNELKGIGSGRSKVKVKGNTTINGSGKLSGIVDICDSNGIENNWGTIQSPAASGCSGYIAKSTCIPDGFGQPTIQDADSDGVADSQDEYPNDATRAFNSYYPNATTLATLAFEDLWPATGDYDYNDLVLGFNIQKVLNASNKVVDYKVKMKVRAIGASFDNGFGFQLDDLAPSDVQTVTGQSFIRSIINRSSNNTEASQTKAVIICFDSPEPIIHRPATGSMFNTIMASPTGTSDTLRVNVTFTAPVEDSKLAIGKFNPFIFANQQRGTEIHMGNFKPTGKATNSLFGTQQDRSVPSGNIYYKTANGMPWAILLPVAFDYPVEKASITSAYSYFDDWAVSGGASNTDWYTSNPGNRNTNNIYATH